MRYIKKVFESRLELDTEYIDMCFIDFIEDSLMDNSYCRNEICKIDILYPKEPNISEGLYYVTQYHKDMLDFLSKVDESINKVKIEYPNIGIDYATCYNYIDSSTGIGYEKYSLNIELNNQII